MRKRRGEEEEEKRGAGTRTRRGDGRIEEEERGGVYKGEEQVHAMSAHEVQSANRRGGEPVGYRSLFWGRGWVS